MLFHGKKTDIPDGWKICDGNNGTPDMRNRYAIGTGSDNTGTKHDRKFRMHVNTNSTGAHTHKFPSNWYYRKMDSGNYTGIDTGGGNVKEQSTQSAGSHHHSVSFNGKPTESHMDLVQLYYIMRII